ncbi:plastocyanin/azurin family copper-binding protein [Halorussus halophilus]|uniref:plastocyanin/azurin family copper-binding protein n=1 Tax=Halorussus halophilus TaxID=2650975 RepID=UPI00130128A9|nr:plastocyanin/azurin family copper-binding protein [Halorussus halophilus]
MNRRSYLAGVGTLAATSLAGCSAIQTTSSSNSGEYDIGMGSTFFRPTELTVKKGTTVVWRNTGNRRHTVTAYEGQLPDGAEYFASGGFDSEQAARDGWMGGLEGRINAGTTFEHTFDVVGEHHYFCIPHEPGGMTGKIVVEE